MRNSRRDIVACLPVLLYGVAIVTVLLGSTPGSASAINLPQSTQAVDAIPADSGHWDTRFQPPSTPAVTQLQIDANDVLYVAGDFEGYSGTVGRGVAKWDGERWANLDASVDASVSSMMADGTGRMFFRGSFEREGANHMVAMWDGSSWTSLGGIGEFVTGMAVDSAGQTFVAGYSIRHTRPPEYVYLGIHQRDNAQWHRINEVPPAVTNLHVGNDDRLYASWDGMLYRRSLGTSDWQAVVPTMQNLTVLRSRQFYATLDDVFTGQSTLARWDGTDWVAIETPGSHRWLSSVFVRKDDTIYAAATNGVESQILSYDGSGWFEVSPTIDGIVRSIAVSSFDHVFAAGSFGTEAAATENVVRWDGSAWRLLATTGSGAMSSVRGLQADHAGNVFATFDDRSQTWDGERWQQLEGRYGDGLYGRPLALGRQGELYTGAGYGVYVLEDGDWTTRPALPICSGQSRWGHWAAAVDHKNQLYVVATCGRNDGGVLRLDGDTWTLLGEFYKPPQGRDLAMRSLAFDTDDRLYVGGHFAEVNGVPAMSIARWDGTDWAQIGDGLYANWDPGPGYVYSLFWQDSTLLAGGAFSHSGVPSPTDTTFIAADKTTRSAIALQNIAAWDSESWSNKGQGLNGAVFDMETDSAGILYAAGDFTYSGSSSAVGLARWDGTRWESVGGGVGGRVNKITVDASGALWVGGSFQRAGDVASSNIAKWSPSFYFPEDDTPDDPDDPNDPESDDTTRSSRIVAAYPNPFSSELSVIVASTVSVSCEVAIYDVLGRRVSVLYDGPLDADDALRLDLSVHGLASGVYALRLTVGDRTDSRIVVRSR